MSKKRNVLLLSLSVMNVRNSENESSYEYTEGRNQIYGIKGRLTNGAPTKYVIENLAGRRMQECLDDIVIISSDTTKMPIRAKGEAAWLDRTDPLLQSPIGDMSHLEYYEKSIQYYVKEKHSDLYKDRNINYYVIDILDQPQQLEVAQAALEAAQKVLGNNDDEKVDLYIDYNGGPRYVASMILSIANMMKNRQVEIKEVLTMNYDNKSMKKDEITGKEIPVIPIQNMKAVFESGELVSGLNEYLIYGRIRGLKNYFKELNAEKGGNILKRMEEFSNELQLCRTNAVFKKKEELKEVLEKFNSSSSEANLNQQNSAKKVNNATREMLFAYVVHDILAGYGDLLDGELPEVISWCVEKDFIQQALTFFVERMPIYFWEKGIFKPTSQEEREYEELKRAFENGEMSEDDQRLYRNHYEKYDDKYAWLTGYLKHGHNFAYGKENSGLMRNKKFSDFVQVDPNAFENIKEVFKKGKSKFPRMVSKDGEVTNKESMLKYLGYLDIGRAETNLSREKLAELLAYYELLKTQRNKANHADDDSENIWSYEFLCKVLKAAVLTLQETVCSVQ